MTTLEETEVKEKLINIIKPFVRKDFDFSKLNDNTRILEDLGVNSARLVDIILDMEETFHIEISDETADKIRTVGKATEIVAQLSHEK